MKQLLLIVAFMGLLRNSYAQNPIIPIEGVKILSDSIPKNGTLDRLEDMIFRAQVPFKMPDGVNLQSDVYLPIFQDDMSFDFDLLGQNFNIKLINRGTQFLIYDSINGTKNPNPYKMPLILTRSPYNKEVAMEASILTLLGYSGVVQDLRGRYASEGTFFPLYSDSWVKKPYYYDKHWLDINPDGHPQNPENFEDGYNTVEFIKNNLYRTYDLNKDGIPDTTDLVYTGAIGMFGASALGYSQTQAAAARKINPEEPGLKALLPIVATGEFQKSTMFPNGTFREMLVTGWLGDQIKDLTENLRSQDNSIQNDIHTSLDFGLNSIQEVTERVIDNYAVRKYSDGKTMQIPNSVARKGVDISYAPVDEMGFGDANGAYNRYSNMEVPSYYLTGWWDIFIDGTIETFQLQRKHLSEKYGNKDKVKMVIGPWAHETITSQRTGDAIYPENVMDVIGANITDFSDGIDIATLVNSDIFNWYRYNLNYADSFSVGLPKFILPKGKLQRMMQGIHVQVPSEDYKVPFKDLINFMFGVEGLKNVPVLLRLGTMNFKLKLDMPKLEEPLMPVGNVNKVTSVETKDFSIIPAVRFYVAGPMKSEGEDRVGNYWIESDDFPIKENITNINMYLNPSSKITSYISDEVGQRTYQHDPNNPVIHLGGANMLGRTPELRQRNFGQINYANPVYKKYVLDNPDVLIYETDELKDTMSLVGFPQARIFASAHPENEVDGAPTDIDFFVRIIDVYPDGREMFVVDGGVNARAREYVKSIAEGQENIDLPYTNIESGKIYEYLFNLLPIAYTFEKGHKMKVIISSSNYHRHQANPCIPLNDGEFFRRTPNDNRTYVFNGKEMAARKSVQNIYFSEEYPTQLILPILGSTKVVSVKDREVKNVLQANIYPNPTSDQLQIFVQEPGQYRFEVLNMLGQVLKTKTGREQSQIDVRDLPNGAYLLNIVQQNGTASKTVMQFIKK